MKKLSLLFTLALATVTVTGCDAFSFINGGNTPETGEDESNEDKDQSKTIGGDDETIFIEGIILEETSVELRVGETYKIEYDVWPHGAYPEVSFDSHNAAIATVTNDGLIEAKSVGNTSITLTSIEDTSVTTNFGVTVKSADFNVTFNANGGSGTMSAAKTNGSSYTTPACTYTYENHNFGGWALNSPTATPKYGVGAELTGIDSDIVLYATWEDSTIPVTNYSVYFNSNGGSGTMTSQTTTGSTYKTPSCTFTAPSGYTFKQWALNSTSGIQYAASSTIYDISSNITLYALWEKASSGSDDFNGYYNSIQDSWTGTTLLNNLNSIIDTNNVSVSYNWSRYEAADEDPNNPNNVILIYARNSVLKSAHVNNGIGWNREHTFPQSKLSNDKAEDDNHIIYASDNKVNGARSNIKMGVVTGGSVVNDYFGNPTTCRKTSSLFDPHNIARGIVARTTMYAAAMYGYDPEDNFESIETMLKWHLEFLPNDDDLRRNNVVFQNQHNRNPFVDHPEYACKIWGGTNSATRSLCGM